MTRCNQHFLKLSMNETDVVIIGAGHNGLTCAAYLAMAGLRVKVVERRKVVGGAAVAADKWDGGDDLPTSPLACDAGPAAAAAAKPYDGGQTTGSPDKAGKPITLEGKYGALVTMQTADGHSHYSGPSDIKTGDRLVLELRKVRDDSGVMQWAIGLSQVPCFRTAYLDHPTRLVIDFLPGSS